MRNASLKTLILSVSIALTAGSAHGALSCFSAHSKNAALASRDRFEKMLKNQKWSEAYWLLQPNKKNVSQAMEDLPEEERKRISQHWAGRARGDVIETPIELLVEISKEMKFRPGETLIDIGSGHGNPGVVFGTLNTGLKIIGYDLVVPKVEGANELAAQLGLSNVKFVAQDLSDPNFQLPAANYYYLFNPAKPEVVERMARQIRELSIVNPNMQVIVFSGGWTPRIFEGLGFERTQKSVDGRRPWAVFQYKAKQLPPLAELVHSFNVFQAEANDRHMQLRAETNFIRRQQGDFEKIWAEASAKLKAFDEKERQHFESIQEAILQTPPMDRIQYLRSLSKEQLLALSPLLDAFFGLDIKKMDQAIDEELGGPNQSQRAEKYGNEQIWYAPRAGQQSDWRSLFDVIESMNLQQGQMVVDLGSGIGRLGLLIGLLRPDVMFNGYEILQARVDAAEQASRALGFYGVSYVQANMSDSGWRPPYADHFYMFNPTNSETSEKLTMKLVELSNTHPFRIYLLTGFQSRSFRNYFQEIKRGHPSIYVRKGSN